MKPLYKTEVNVDDFTKAATVAFDYTFEGVSIFEGWEKPNIYGEFGIGLILGPSGSGKSLLLKQFGNENIPKWDSKKAVVSHFLTPQEAIDKLMAVGLNSIPTWCKPYQVLSNGEKFRVDLARKLHNNAIIDEFTSVVDRNVAKASCVAFKRYVEKNKLTGIVLASCHSDILEWLRPDWYFDTTTGLLNSGRLLRRPPIELRIYPCKKSVWAMFAKHHYLSNKLNNACRSFLATAVFKENEEIIVGFASSLTMPNGYIKNGWREHRTVILPDFQGLGLGPRLSDSVAELHIQEGKRYFSRTAHPRFGEYREGSLLWKRTSKFKKLRTDVDKTKNWGKEHNYFLDDKRICYSHEYTGIQNVQN